MARANHRRPSTHCSANRLARLACVGTGIKAVSLRDGRSVPVRIEDLIHRVNRRALRAIEILLQFEAFTKKVFCAFAFRIEASFSNRSIAS